MSREDFLRTAQPELVADVTLYPTASGGRRSTAFLGWGCPCCVSNKPPIVGYDGWPLLDETPLNPGDRRRLGFVFLSSKEAADVMRAAGKFYLWEGGFIGEAVVVAEGDAAE